MALSIKHYSDSRAGNMWFMGGGLIVAFALAFGLLLLFAHPMPRADWDRMTLWGSIITFAIGIGLGEYAHFRYIRAQPLLCDHCGAVVKKWKCHHCDTENEGHLFKGCVKCNLVPSSYRCRCGKVSRIKNETNSAVDTRYSAKDAAHALQMEELNASERRYSSPGVFNVTVKTDPATREVSFTWAFLRRSTVEQSIGVEGSNRSLSGDIAVTQFFEGLAILNPQSDGGPFAMLPRSRMHTGVERRKLPDGTWYFRVGIRSDDVEECFTHTAHVQEAGDERSWQTQLDGIMHGFRKYEEARARGEQLIKDINARTDLDASQKRDRVRYVQRELEKMLRGQK